MGPIHSVLEGCLLCGFEKNKLVGRTQAFCFSPGATGFGCVWLFAYLWARGAALRICSEGTGLACGISQLDLQKIASVGAYESDLLLTSC